MARSKSSSRPFAQRRNPTGLGDLFGPAPLIEGEDLAVYCALLADLSEVLRPGDILEQLFVHDFAYLQWEVMRYRRLKAEVMKTRKFDAFRSLVDLRREAERYFVEQSEEEFRQVELDWLHQDPSTPAEVGEKFAQAGLTRQAVMAATLFENIDVIARIDELIAMAEARRNNALRELDRHRATLGQATRRTIKQIEQIEDAKQKEKAA